MDREKTDGGIYVMVRYDRLWKLLIDKKMNRTELKEAAGISFNVLARLGKNEPVSFESIEKICGALECNIEDIMEVGKSSLGKKTLKRNTTKKHAVAGEVLRPLNCLRERAGWHSELRGQDLKRSG